MKLIPEYRISKREIELNAKTPYVIAFNNPDKIHRHFLGDLHFALQICIIIEGEFEAAYPDSDNFCRRLEKGQLFLSSVWEAHGTRELSHPSKMMAISFSIENLGFHGVEDDELNWLAPFALHPSLRPYGETSESREKILEIAENIDSINKAKPFAHKTKIWLKILELVLYLSEIVPLPKGVVRPKPIERIIQAVLMVQNAAGTCYPTIHECAAACGLSRSRFSNIFSSVMGFSFGKFIVRSKMSKAARLVRNSSSPFKEIAAECGFCDLSSFHHAFRNYFKCAPGEFRKNASLLKDNII